MVELDAGIAAQMAMVQQKAAMSFMKQAADSQKQIADILASTVTPSGRGQAVDVSA